MARDGFGLARVAAITFFCNSAIVIAAEFTEETDDGKGLPETENLMDTTAITDRTSTQQSTPKLV